MVDETPELAVAIDTASEFAGLALFDSGRLISEHTWLSNRNHSRELLPGLDWLLQRAGRDKKEIGSVFICLGPGSYAGLRVGLSTAKALAFGLDAKIAGVGRLVADAFPFLGLIQGRVFAVHAAGRAELAWAAYSRSDAEAAHEEIAPRLGPMEELLESVEVNDLVCGELATLPEPLMASLKDRETDPVEVRPFRAYAVGVLGRVCLAAGQVDLADSLVPLYLREPAIGPQPPRA